MVACMRVGSTISVSGPAARRAGAADGRGAAPLPPAAASTSSRTMRPSGPVPLIVARSTPSSAARRLASGEALTAAPPAAPSLLRATGGTTTAGFADGGGSAPVSAGTASAASAGSVAASGVSVSSTGSAFAFASTASAFGFSGFAPSAFAALAPSPAAPMLAIGAPILAGTPLGTMIFRTPSASASRSNVALSDSTSARTSPLWTSSPSFFFHSRTVPSSIVSESFGMLTSAIGFSSIGFSPNNPARHPLDVLAGRNRRLFERQAVRHRDLRAAQPENRRVEVVEAPLLHARRDLGGDPIRRPSLFHDKAASRSSHRFHDGPPVDWADRAEVDHLDVDVLLLELLRRLVGEHRHPRDAHDGQVRSFAADRGLADGDRVVTVGNHSADVVQAHRLQEDDGVVRANCRLEHALCILRRGRCHDQQSRDEAVQHLEAVRMLRRELVTGAAWHSDHHRNLGLATEHVSDLRRVVHYLV